MSADEPREARERLRRVETLYHEMLARPAQERDAALLAACPGDAEVRGEVKALLAQPESAAGPLGTPALDAAARLLSDTTSALAGKRLGVFEVLELLGAGGMGEVYRARDTRLGRSVAIKILPRAFKDDPDRSIRFEREARLLASLNHPHVCTLYDVGHHEGFDYLVMEVVEGETLAARLSRGALPLDQALRTAIEIADALDKAHRQGVIHRDLKPANVMLTKSGAKLMDFGLAKLTRAEEAGDLAPALKTGAVPLTGAGMLIGTVPYMAPEQLEGKGPDARSDLWALGCVMYEMVTGRAAFEGKTQAALISAIMAASPPPIQRLQPLAPAALERLIRVCLAKDPDDRFQIAHDVMQELKWIAEAPPGSGAARGIGVAASRVWRRGWIRAACVVLASLGFGAVLGGRLLAPPPDRTPIIRSLLDVGPADELKSGSPDTPTPPTRGGSRTALTWTPDGRSLVFVGRQGGLQRLYVRALDADEARVIEGTEGAQTPAVSPDGRWLAFWANGAIRRVPLEGGPVTPLHLLVERPAAMAWGGDGRLFFSRTWGAIVSVAAEQPATPVTKVLEDEAYHTSPHPLPDGRALLYTVRHREWTWGDEQVVAHVFATGERKVLLNGAADARFVAPGYLVFMRRGTLFGVGFDPDHLDAVGIPIPLLDGVSQALIGRNPADIAGAGQFSVASTGALAWLPGPVWLPEEAVPGVDMNIVAVDRRGQARVVTERPRAFGTMGLSSNGMLAVTVLSLTELGLWMLDLDRGTFTRLPGEGEVGFPRFSPDGQRIAFRWLDKGIKQLAWQRSDGMGQREMMSKAQGTAASWSPDGTQLAFHRNDDIWIATVAGGEVTTKPLFETTAVERWAEFSPDGKWLAYASNVSGRYEIYIQPYPGGGPRQQVSLAGGRDLAWNRSGNELFFVSLPDSAGRQHMMSVALGPGPQLSISKPQRLFALSPEQSWTSNPSRAYAVAPDGQLFYCRQPAPIPSPSPVTHINLVTNWVEELKAKVASGHVK